MFHFVKKNETTGSKTYDTCFLGSCGVLGFHDGLDRFLSVGIRPGLSPGQPIALDSPYAFSYDV